MQRHPVTDLPKSGSLKNAEIFDWGMEKSLSEHLRDLQNVLSTNSEGLTFKDLYIRIYRRIFGRSPSTALDSKRSEKLLAKACQICQKVSADPEMFISAQMFWLSTTKAVRKFGFQPNMLVGEKAESRYNAHLFFANKRFRRARSDVYDDVTTFGGVSSTLFVSEMEVGSYFIKSNLAGEKVSWFDAVDACNPSMLWSAVDHPDRSRRLTIRHGTLFRKFSPEDLTLAKRIAQLRAAIAVVDSHQHRMSDRIGFSGDFSWEGLLDLLSRVLVYKVPNDCEDLVEVSGCLWGYTS